MKFDAILKEIEPGVIQVYGERRVMFSVVNGFCSLKRTFQQLEGEKGASKIFYDAGIHSATRIAKRMLSEGAQKNKGSAELIFRYFRHLGWGDLALDQLEDDFSRAQLSCSNMAEVWGVKEFGIQPKAPVCDYIAGVIAGFFRAIRGSDDVHCIEKTCQALGSEKCIFEIVPINEGQEREENVILAKEALEEREDANKHLKEVIEAQQHFIKELSTPVIEVWEGILILPLIGTIDSQRTLAIMENLLEQIIETQSEIAIIDLRGVPLVDTQVANSLMRAAEAASLLGAKTFLAGISPNMARTFVHIGADLSSVQTFASLREALLEAIDIIDKRPESARAGGSKREVGFHA